MSRWDFSRAGEAGLPEEWRPLERMLHRWVLRRGGSELLAATAAWAGFVESHGDAALRLDAPRRGAPALSAAQIEALRASPLVATRAADGLRPFVLDADARFYLWRNHAHECAIAAAVAARRAAAEPAPPAATLAADLALLFADDPESTVARQRAAVAGVCGKRLFVLTGGPGTGKTTTVLRMLLMLQRQAGRALELRLAAPTGKAGQRLAQALRVGKAALRAAQGRPLPPEWLARLDAIPEGEALTVHRLLGYEPWRNRFRHGAAHPLAADVVVIDEASMLDLPMLRALLDAVPLAATLILVGDADQLDSVGTGSVLSDLVAAFEATPRGDLIRLRHSFRAERELVEINEAVRKGDLAAFQAAVQAAGTSAALREIAALPALQRFLLEHAAAIAAEPDLRVALPLGAGGEVDPSAAAPLVAAAFRALLRRQLLCARREGEWGALAAGAALEAELRRRWQVRRGAHWYAGRAVLITRNDYRSGLRNGDVGLCLADAEGRLQVWFEPLGDGSPRAFAPQGLPPYESALALTVHKSQGSEYERVAVLLPPEAESRILSRQLLYTGLSRARRSLELVGARASIEAALARDVQRAGGLREKLTAAATNEEQGAG